MILGWVKKQYTGPGYCCMLTQTLTDPSSIYGPHNPHRNTVPHRIVVRTPGLQLGDLGSISSEGDFIQLHWRRGYPV